jgi:hypothetical protein
VTVTPLVRFVASIIADRPSRVSGLVTVTFSWYVPPQTTTVPPPATAARAVVIEWYAAEPQFLPFACPLACVDTYTVFDALACAVAAAMTGPATAIPPTARIIVVLSVDVGDALLGRGPYLQAAAQNRADRRLRSDGNGGLRASTIDTATACPLLPAPDPVDELCVEWPKGLD